MIVIDQTLCAGCATCVTVCPVEAIECPGMAEVEADICTECLECLDFCPTDAISHWEPEKERAIQAVIALPKESYAE